MTAPETAEIVRPAAWRKSANLSGAEAARRVGVAGKNPAGTWHKWETGSREPPLTVIRDVTALSGGKVTLQSWIETRQDYEQRRRAS